MQEINFYIGAISNPIPIYPTMADTISYQYAALSALQRAADQDELCLAKYSEIEKKDAPCFFWGEVDTTLYDGTLPHRSVQRSTIQF